MKPNYNIRYRYASPSWHQINFIIKHSHISCCRGHYVILSINMFDFMLRQSGISLVLALYLDGIGTTVPGFLPIPPPPSSNAPLPNNALIFCLLPNDPRLLDSISMPSMIFTHSHGSMVPGLICINDHLAKEDVISPQATDAGVREKMSIPQYSIYPLDSIIPMPDMSPESSL